MPDKNEPYMPDEKTREAVAKASINNERIRVAVNDPNLIGKVKTAVTDLNEDLFWYIKFNIVLDPLSISRKTMNVMETDGYILDSHISYDSSKNLIVIKPIDPYKEGIFYILNIKKKVRSIGGNNMKRDIHILFKIKEGRISSDYKILGPNVTVAKPKKKPASLKAQTVSKVYSFDDKQKKKIAKMPKDMLPYDNMKVNFLAAIIGLIIALAGLMADFLPVVAIGGIGLLIGLIHLSVQFAVKKERSVLQYNIGVIMFNAGFYKSAKKHFAKAFKIDELNEMAEYALNKTSFFL